MFDEEESKKFRILQREKRQELQLIIERCNEVDFDYVCVPSIRNGEFCDVSYLCAYVIQSFCFQTKICVSAAKPPGKFIFLTIKLSILI
jgi:hypothetical protein